MDDKKYPENYEYCARCWSIYGLIVSAQYFYISKVFKHTVNLCTAHAAEVLTEGSNITLTELPERIIK